MIDWLKERLKWWIAGKEMAELNRWRFQHNYYRLCLYDVELVRDTLESLKARVDMKSVNCCLPPFGDGPFGVDGIRARWDESRSKVVTVTVPNPDGNLPQ